MDMITSKKPASIYDVAKLAGVSPSTVSRYLNRSTYVSDEKSYSIEKAIQKSGYKVTYKTKGPIKGRSMTIGVLLQNADSPFMIGILKDLEACLSSRGYSLVIATGHWKRRLEKHALDYFFKSHVDGVIIVSGDLSDEELIEYSLHTPIVAVGYNKIKANNILTIEFDNVLGGYLATLHLLQQGHVNIAHIKGLCTQPDGQRRYEGYRRALKDRGIPVNSRLIKQGDFSSEQGYQKTIELLDSKVYFSAIFAANDQTAYGAIKALHDRGVRVPEDVSVIGFDDLQTSSYFTPALTTLRQPIEELGSVCAEAIFKMLSGEEHQVRVPPIDLIVRESTSSIFDVYKNINHNR